MLRSMTGFGQAMRAISGYKLQIDVKSVNHRYGEIVIRMPREWLLFEDNLRKLVQQSVKRGRVDVFVTVDRDEQTGQHASVNWPLVESYYAAAERIRERWSLSGEERLKPGELLSLPDAVTVAEERLDSSDQMREQLEAAMIDALNQLMNMRETEGRNLHEELSARIRIVAGLRDALEKEAPEAVEHMRKKLKSRIHEMLNDSSQFDEQRFVMEVAVLAERSNIDEELARLTSHCLQFQALLEADEPVGRKLDFLIQEMNREVNTIGSKGNYTSITNLVVELKAELEKIREQVQNIE